MYYPLNYDAINVQAGTYAPSSVKAYNNETYSFWERSLFQRAVSVLEFVKLPWSGNELDFFKYCLFRFGYLTISKNAEFGLFFQPCSLGGMNFYYQPLWAQISNPLYNEKLDIGTQCELVKLTPDYIGIYDIVQFYAYKLATICTSIDTSLINSKLAYIIASKNKASAEALKKIFDKINKGEPAVFFDKNVLNDPTDKTEPWQFLERKDLKSSYLATDLLQDFDTILRQFDTEIGIPTISDKKERLVVSEAETKTIDATSRSKVWLETVNSSLEKVNKLYGLNISARLTYDDMMKGGADNGEL